MRSMGSMSTNQGIYRQNVKACARISKTHGCPGMKERHVGDLGNLVTNKNGQAKYTMTNNYIKLRGSKAYILGRGLIIHADPDDCGKGNNPDSLTTGNSGKRIACAIIGYAKENFI